MFWHKDENKRIGQFKRIYGDLVGCTMSGKFKWQKTAEKCYKCVSAGREITIEENELGKTLITVNGDAWDITQNRVKLQALGLVYLADSQLKNLI